MAAFVLLVVGGWAGWRSAALAIVAWMVAVPRMAIKGRLTSTRPSKAVARAIIIEVALAMAAMAITLNPPFYNTICSDSGERDHGDHEAAACTAARHARSLPVQLQDVYRSSQVCSQACEAGS